MSWCMMMLRVWIHLGRAGTESTFFVIDACVNCLFVKNLSAGDSGPCCGESSAVTMAC